MSTYYNWRPAWNIRPMSQRAIREFDHAITEDQPAIKEEKSVSVLTEDQPARTKDQFVK